MYSNPYLCFPHTLTEILIFLKIILDLLFVSLLTDMNLQFYQCYIQIYFYFKVVRIILSVPLFSYFCYCLPLQNYRQRISCFVINSFLTSLHLIMAISLVALRLQRGSVIYASKGYVYMYFETPRPFPRLNFITLYHIAIKIQIYGTS